MLNHSRGLWGGRWRAAGVNLLVCMLMAARGVGGSKDGVDAGDDVSLRQGAGGRGAGSGGEAGRLPTWFDDETMRVVGPEDTMYMGCDTPPHIPSPCYSRKLEAAPSILPRSTRRTASPLHAPPASAGIHTDSVRPSHADPSGIAAAHTPATDTCVATFTICFAFSLMHTNR
jgi:hypothetical protein